MRLLHTTDLTLRTFYGFPPSYVILSHTWGDGAEVTLQELEAKGTSDKAGWAKIVNFCSLAKKKGYDWAWIDTCCIDKTSSAELQEAINSMYRYYRDSDLCIVHMADVPSKDGSPDWESTFKGSRWFQRGWTLQELLAPTDTEFWSADWTELLGTKGDLISLIQSATRISDRALSYFDPKAHYAVDILHWASSRQCTRKEDEAYALLGLLDINMPLLYGEGERAFVRLQQEVITGSDDESILAWSLPPREPLSLGSSLFAPSVSYFSIPARRTEEEEDAAVQDRYRCKQCNGAFRFEYLLKNHDMLCRYGAIEIPRPFVMGNRGLHVRRVLYLRQPKTRPEYFVLLNVSRDWAAENELLLRIVPMQDRKQMLSYPLHQDRLNYVLCDRTSLHSRQEFDSPFGSISVAEYELMILKSPPTQRS
jgi:hypothetical protein